MLTGGRLSIIRPEQEKPECHGISETFLEFEVEDTQNRGLD